MAQLVQVGLPSSQRMCRLLHSLQPFRDLRCERLVLVLASPSSLLAAMMSFIPHCSSKYQQHLV